MTIDPITITPSPLPNRRPPVFGRWTPARTIWRLQRDPVDLLTDAYHACGPVFRLELAAARPIVLAGPEAMAAVTACEREFFQASGQLDEASRHFGLSPDSMMVNTDGDRHRALRRHMKAPMSRSAFEAALDVIIPTIDATLARFAARPQTELVAACKQLVFAQLGLAMNGDVPSELFVPGKRIMDGLVDGVSRPWRLWYAHSGVRSALKVYAEYAQQQRTRSGEKTFLATMFDGIDKGLYRGEDLAILAATPYIAGLDTAAHALAFALIAFARHPDALDEVREELDAEAPSGLPTWKRLPVLRAAIMESMRCYPVTSLQARTARCDMNVHGYRIGAGERVLFAPTVSHRLASCYPAPEVFDLHRYDPDRAEHRTPGAFLPYGVGVHICLGAGIADALIVATLARLLAHYEPLIHPQPDRLRIRARPTPAPVGFRLQLSPRQRTSQAA